MLLLLALVILPTWLLRSPHTMDYLLSRIGSALGLQIHVDHIEYTLHGTPELIVRNLTVQRAGDSQALLSAQRARIRVPWSTLRSLGSDLNFERVELDSPLLNLPALQRWLDTRPPSETRLPNITHGVRIRDGRIDNDDWRIDHLDITLATLNRDQPVRLTLRGRYLDPPIQMPFEFDVALTHPGNDAGAAAIGSITVEGDGWRLPARVRLSGPLHIGKDDLQMAPAKLGIAARYLAGDTQLPFQFGAYGTLRFDDAVWSLQPATLVLRGREAIPNLDATGAAAIGRRFVLRLTGQLAAWPNAWPSLPAPLSESSSPFPFTLAYMGNIDLRDASTLTLQRDATMFTADFHLPDMLAWVDAKSGSPLPPLQGTLRTPKLDVAGATLEGIEVDFDDGTQPP